MTNIDFGEKIKRHRKALGFTQTQFGLMLGVSQVTVANYERGERFPKQSTLIAMSRIFGISLDSLLVPDRDEDIASFPESHQFTVERFTEILLHELPETAFSYSLSWKKIQKLDLLRFYETVILPALKRTGDLWARGEILVAQEHLISQKVRELILLHSKLEMDSHPQPSVSGKRWLGFCAPGEKHDLVLLMLGQVLRNRGWCVHFLGTQVPCTDLISFMETYKPTHLSISVTMSENVEACETYVRQIRKHFGNRIVLQAGGSGFSRYAIQPEGFRISDSLREGIDELEKK